MSPVGSGGVTARSGGPEPPGAPPGEERTPGSVALALSGGAARAMAHIGVLKALEAHGITPRMVAGTSSGAILAALYALSGSALEVERIVRAQDVGEVWRQALDFGLHRGALVNGRRLSDWLDRKFFFGASFADARVPLKVACTDLETGRLVTLNSGPVAEAVRASSALPGFFAPVRREGSTLIDGGFLEPVPFSSLAGTNARLIGVQAGIDVRRSRLVRAIRRFNVSRTGREFRRRANRLRGGGSLSRVVKGIALSTASYSILRRIPSGATVLRVDPGIAWWDFHRSPRAIAAGEEAALALLEALTVPSEA